MLARNGRRRGPGPSTCFFHGECEAGSGCLGTNTVSRLYFRGWAAAVATSNLTRDIQTIRLSCAEDYVGDPVKFPTGLKGVVIIATATD